MISRSNAARKVKMKRKRSYRKNAKILRNKISIRREKKRMPLKLKKKRRLSKIARRK